jgi:hypothetical protein
MRGSAAEASTTMDQRERDHVVDVVVTIRKVRKRALLVDDAHRSLLRPDLDGLDILGGLATRFELVV